MKHARLIWTGLAVLVVAGTAAFALASGKACRTGATAATASASTCSAAAAANCTPGQAASCTARGTSTASDAGCPMHGATATTALAKGARCPYMKDAGAGCPMHDGQATAASAGSCVMHGAQATAASAGSCSMHGEIGAMAGRCAKGAKATAVTASAGGSCAARGAAAAATGACDACADMAACNADIAEAGGKVQIVPLKNGLMYVYSAETSAKVRAVQAAVARHAERVNAINAAGDKAHLCNDCREMRGAAASGKLTREVVNIESGCLTLVTSNDPRIVSRLYAMAGVSNNGAAHPTIKS